jgi:hypothetical protein
MRDARTKVTRSAKQSGIIHHIACTRRAAPTTSLPRAGEFEYRIKHPHEHYERVAAESDLNEFWARTEASVERWLQAASPPADLRG